MTTFLSLDERTTFPRSSWKCVPSGLDWKTCEQYLNRSFVIANFFKVQKNLKYLNRKQSIFRQTTHTCAKQLIGLQSLSPWATVPHCPVERSNPLMQSNFFDSEVNFSSRISIWHGKWLSTICDLCIICNLKSTQIRRIFRRFISHFYRENKRCSCSSFCVFSMTSQ